MKIIRLLLLIVIIVFAMWLCIWIIQSLFPRRIVLAGVNPTSIEVNQPFNFSDSTQAAQSWLWLFGDGGKATTQQGSYSYKMPGRYLVKLIVDKELTHMMEIRVREKPTLSKKNDVISIDGATVGFQGEYLFFSAQGDDSNWRWNLGEGPGVDSRDPVVIHKYNKPGRYTIHLMSKKSKYPAVFVVKILPPYKDVDSTDVVDVFDVINNDIKGHLQQIANGNDFNSNYYYLVNKYLCRDEHVPVNIDGKKINDFFSYCMGLRLDKGTIISSVTNEQKTIDTVRCIVRLNVKQRQSL